MEIKAHLQYLASAPVPSTCEVTSTHGGDTHKPAGTIPKNHPSFATFPPCKSPGCREKDSPRHCPQTPAGEAAS